MMGELKGSDLPYDMYKEIMQNSAYFANDLEKVSIVVCTGVANQFNRNEEAQMAFRGENPGDRRIARFCKRCGFERG